MINRFFLIISLALLAFSCSRFVNLGDSDKACADNTEGLPDEIYEDSGDRGADPGDYADWNEDNADAEYSDNGAADNASGSYEDEIEDSEINDDSNNWEEDSDPESENIFPDEDTAAYIFPESNPFPEEFSNVECGCGDIPQYNPVCCNGVISVFNSCFANCYAIHSGNKICTVYNEGLCAAYEKSDDDDEEEASENDPEENGQDDEIADDDTEIPDSDEDSVNVEECGCVPEAEAAVFRCGENSYAVTSCLANCICAEPEKLFL